MITGKATAAILSVMLLIALSVGGGAVIENHTNPELPAEDSSPNAESSLQTDTSDGGETNILIAYFSRTGENYGVGYIEKGNTSIVADVIAKETGGDLFEIRTVTPYPDSYDEATEVARQEKDENARPELIDDIDDISDYDVIFLGYPIWWGDMPMAVYTFLESHDFSGKTVVPFCTHAGSGIASTEKSIADICSGATVSEGFEILGSTAQNEQEETENAVIDWLDKTSIVE